MHNHVNQPLLIFFTCFTKIGRPSTQRSILSRYHFQITISPKIRSAEAGWTACRKPQDTYFPGRGKHRIQTLKSRTDSDYSTDSNTSTAACPQGKVHALCKRSAASHDPGPLQLFLLPTHPLTQTPLSPALLSGHRPFQVVPTLPNFAAWPTFLFLKTLGHYFFCEAFYDFSYFCPKKIIHLLPLFYHCFLCLLNNVCTQKCLLQICLSSLPEGELLETSKGICHYSSLKPATFPDTIVGAYQLFTE